MLGITGCWAASSLVSVPFSIAGNGYIAWRNGEAFKYYPYNKDIMSRATQRAFNRMGLTVLNVYRNDTDGCECLWIRFYDRSQGYAMLAGNNNAFNLNIDQKEQNISIVRCRVDFWGDKSYVELLYKYIDEEINNIEFSSGGSIKSQF
jgi:hypothetical protein